VNNSSFNQQDTKIVDNQNYDHQQSVMKTMNKYNEDITKNNPNLKKQKEKCIIF
jgi:hypothetical protein